MKRRLAWRCRRGSKELDLILEAFIRRHGQGLDGLDETDLRRFDLLLECADPQLTDYLCNGAQPADPELTAIVERILSAPRA